MLRPYDITAGSAVELDYHLLLARDLQMLEETVYHKIFAEMTDVRRMLNGFIQKLKANG